MVAGWVATYYGNLAVTNEKVADLKTQIEVIKEKSQNLNEKIDRIDQNVQKIGDRFGVQYLEKDTSSSVTKSSIMTKKP